VRRVFFWLHLSAGVVAGLVVLVMSVTGVLLTYEKQMVAWADRGYRSAPPSKDAPSLGMEALLGRVREARPESPIGAITLRRDPEAPVQLALGREGTLYVDRYTGAVLGEGSRGIRAFFRKVTDWHRWLAAEGESRALGRGVTGASNLAFLFLVASGFYLWWPREWTRTAVASVTWFRGGLSGRARDFNWHNVVGFWTAVPLFFVVLGGVLLSYPWASDLLYRAVGSEPPPRRSGPAPGPSPEEGRGRRKPPSLEGLDPLFAQAESRMADWRSISLRLPGSPDDNLTFTIDAGSGGRPDLRAQLVLDRKTGGVVRWEPYESQSLGRRLRSWMRFVHTGEAGGIVGQTVAGLASAGSALLVWTGLAMAWRRFEAWRARGRRARAPSPAAAASTSAS
jgi:uncharacterized iron-regulated membrane protein